MFLLNVFVADFLTFFKPSPVEKEKRTVHDVTLF